MRFMPKQSFKIVRIDSWDIEISAAISLKLKWRFLLTISFTLAMLTSFEDVDRRPQPGKYFTTSRLFKRAFRMINCRYFLTECTYFFFSNKIWFFYGIFKVGFFWKKFKIFWMKVAPVWNSILRGKGNKLVNTAREWSLPHKRIQCGIDQWRPWRTQYFSSKFTVNKTIDKYLKSRSTNIWRLLPIFSF